MNINSEQLVDKFKHLITDVSGTHRDDLILASLEEFDGNSLIFVQDKPLLPDFSTLSPAAIITNDDVFSTLKSSFSGLLICVSDVRLSLAQIKQAYNDYQHIDSEWDIVHKSAIIHESAQLGKGVHIGPNSVIGANVIIGDYSVVRANSVIEHDVQIGNNTIINNLVNIGYGSSIGNNTIIRSGCTIAGEGFGFAQDSERRSHRIPHTGSVVIGDNVLISSQCNIDRGTYGNTVIHKGVKIDAFNHIAHNVDVGEDTILVAQSGIAGSSKLGKRVVMSGQSAVIDHMTVCDDAVLVQRAGVTKDITEAGTWAGTPAKPIKEYIQGLGLSKKVARMEQTIKQLKEKLEKL